MGEDFGRKPSIIARIKRHMEIWNEGARLGRVFYTRSDRKPRRVRFLTEFDKATVVKMHWYSYMDASQSTPCLSHLGEECLHCSDPDTYKTIFQDAWTVTHLDQERNYVFCFSDADPRFPVHQMYKHWESYGTLLDRVYLVSAKGKWQSKRWKIVPESEEPETWGIPLGTEPMVSFTDDAVYKILLAGVLSGG